MTLANTTDRIGKSTMASWNVSGPGTPVVCVHGAGVSSRQTVPLLDSLAGLNEAWAVDLPGFGRSEAPAPYLTVPQLADALLEWTRAKGIERPCLLGVSMGCQVVVEAALRAPGEVSALVLVGPTVDPWARSLPALAARFVRNGLGESPRLLPMSIADYRDAGVRRGIRTWKASRRDPIEDKLSRVDAPALVIRGEKDALTPQPWAEEVTRLLPRGRLLTLPGQAHAVTVSAPNRLAHHVHHFLQEAAR